MWSRCTLLFVWGYITNCTGAGIQATISKGRGNSAGHECGFEQVARHPLSYRSPAGSNSLLGLQAEVSLGGGPWTRMAAETPSEDLGMRSLKKPCSFTIENILSIPAEKRSPVLLPFCFRGLLDCEPRGLCTLGTLAASSLQEEEESEEAEVDFGQCGCCCCSHTGAHSWQETSNWLGKHLSFLCASPWQSTLCTKSARGL